MSHSNPEYRFDSATGQLFFENSGTSSIVGDADLAVAWTTDEDIGGCLQKHGPAGQVEKKVAPLRAIDPTLTVAVIPWEAIRHPDAGPQILEEINACLAISGRVKDFDSRIAEIAEAHEVEIFPRDTRSEDHEVTP